MTAAEVKAVLYRRHPATAEFGPGPWTCIEEWAQIDLLALAAWTQPSPARCRHARIGYEVKVSRGDYKRELAKPSKRARAVAFCHEFYIAVPEGLLRPEEQDWKEPPVFTSARGPFERVNCPGAYGAGCVGGCLTFGQHPLPEGGRTFKGGRWQPRLNRERAYSAECVTCRGLGWVAESPAVRYAAPPLWIPADVGLVAVTAERVRVVRKAPLNPDPKPVDQKDLGQFVRWVSVRPDPRHERWRRSPSGVQA